MKTLHFILLLLLVLFVSNVALYFYLNGMPTDIIESYTSYSDLSTAISSDPSFKIMISDTYNDASYQEVLESANLEIYDVTRPYAPPTITDPRTNYMPLCVSNADGYVTFHSQNAGKTGVSDVKRCKTDNYNIEYHDNYELSNNYLEGSDIFKVGYQSNGAFRYGSRSFVPNYEEATLLSSVLKVYQGQEHPSQQSGIYTLLPPIPTK